MGVMEHRIAVEDVQTTRADYLNYRHETAFLVVDFGRLTCCRPGFPLGDLREIHHCVLDTLAGSNRHQWLLANAAANLDILVGNDLSSGYSAAEDNLALDRSATGDRALVIGLHGCGDHRSDGARDGSNDLLGDLHQRTPELLKLPRGADRADRKEGIKGEQ